MNDRSVSHQSRRADLAERSSEETGIDGPMIDVLVRRFYEKVRADALLGLIFETRISDWESHLKRMCEFWSQVALMTGRYHGTPMAKHFPLRVDAEHFDRWLALFEETAREMSSKGRRSLYRARAAYRRKPGDRNRRVQQLPSLERAALSVLACGMNGRWMISQHGPNASKSSTAAVALAAGGWRLRDPASAYAKTDAPAWWSWTTLSPRSNAPKIRRSGPKTASARRSAFRSIASRPPLAAV